VVGNKLKDKIQLARSLQLAKEWRYLSKDERRITVGILFDSYLRTWDHKLYRSYRMELPFFYWTRAEPKGIVPCVSWKCNAIRVKKKGRNGR